MGSPTGPSQSEPGAPVQWQIREAGSGALTAPLLRELFDYWRGLRREGALPSRADVDPAAIKRMLPYLYMVDVSREPLRFRYRLVGTGIVEFTGRDVTGKVVGEATYGTSLEVIRRFFETVVETRGPVGGRGRTVWIQGGEWRNVESLVLPMASDGATIDILLAGYVVVGQSRALPGSDDQARTERVEIIPAPRFVPEDAG